MMRADPALTPTSLTHAPEPSIPSGYTGLAQELVAAWPSQAELLEIYALPICLSTHSHMHLCTPSSAMSQEEQASTKQMLQLPPIGCHPVLIARKLLFLGSLLQGALSGFRVPESSRSRYREIMSQAIDISIKLVTTNDSLTASVEGAECILIESMIHNYTGNLHRAWMAVRRATAAAHLIGLHRGTAQPSLKVLDPTSKAGYDPAVLCFRIVEMDTYLSMILGLPQSSLQMPDLTPKALTTCQPIDRMARLHCSIASRVLKQNGRTRLQRGIEELSEMEELLRQASQEMPPQWWLIPDLTSSKDGLTTDPFSDMARVNYQFSHYHLVMRLHLPYMLRPASSDHSKIVAANASREMLHRYIAFRRWNPGHFYCRGVDFLAFVAVTVLCLAHMDSGTTDPNIYHDTSPSTFMAQSHPSDRGMMEHSVSILRNMRNDATASVLAKLMQHLLDVENNAANGVGYKAVATESVDGRVQCNRSSLDSQDPLRLHIPYFGTISFHRKPFPKAVPGTISNQRLAPALFPTCGLDPNQRTAPYPEIPAQWDNRWSHQPLPPYVSAGPNSTEVGIDDWLNPSLAVGAADDLTLQNINENLFSSIFDSVADGEFLEPRNFTA
jgi:hypothetical protein